MKVIIPHCMGKSRKNIRRKLKQDVGLNFVMDVYNVLQCLNSLGKNFSVHLHFFFPISLCDHLTTGVSCSHHTSL